MPAQGKVASRYVDLVAAKYKACGGNEPSLFCGYVSFIFCKPCWVRSVQLFYIIDEAGTRENMRRQSSTFIAIIANDHGFVYNICSIDMAV